MSNIGAVLRDRYELIAEIGRGGMSQVYLAKDLHLDSYWAVKQVKNNSSVEFAAFKKEVELLASLNYPDIPRIVDRIEIGDDYYVVMDFVDGTSLGKKVLKEGVQPEQDVVEWGVQICDALDYLHHVRDNPIVYCDMKPENVMLNQAGRIKLIDFGIAKECVPGKKHSGASVGTKGYAAPEQYKSGSNMLDERTDVYSLGATLFYLLTGSQPKPPPDGIPSVRKINPQVSEGMEYIITKSTQSDPGKRYQSVAEMREDLSNIESLTGDYRQTMRKRLIAFVTSLTLAVVFGLVSVFGFLGMQADQEDKYQTAYQSAVAYERAGDYANAANEYAVAIEHKPDDYDTHVFLLNAMLQQGEEDDAALRTRNAIDIMRKSYLDNEQSPMYHNPDLMYRVIQLCLEVEDPNYARYALDYIQLLKQTPTYTQNQMTAQGVNAYEVLATYLAQDVERQDFANFEQALAQLSALADNSERPLDERLENYYIVIKMYATYPAHLDSPAENIYQNGLKAKALVETISSEDESSFSAIVPMYSLVAASQYNYASMAIDTAATEQCYMRSIEWFDYLDDLSVNLSESLALKRANAYRRIYDLYANTGNAVPAQYSEYLDKSILYYDQVVRDYPESFLGHVYLAQAYLEKELQQPQEQRNYALVRQHYTSAMTIRDERGDLSSAELAQFSSLRQQMLLAGLEA